jgi:hypothetical protein
MPMSNNVDILVLSTFQMNDSKQIECIQMWLKHQQHHSGRFYFNCLHLSGIMQKTLYLLSSLNVKKY